MTQAVGIIGPITVSASSLIALSDLAHDAKTFDVTAANTLAFTQATQNFGDHRVSAQNTIVIDDMGDTTIKARTVAQALTLSQSAIGVASKTATSILILSQLTSVIQETQNVAQTLTLTQQATIPHTIANTLSLTQLAVAEPPDPVRIIAPQILSLTQTATVVTNSTKLVANTLSLVQGVAYTLEKSTTFCDFSPFIGENSDPNAPTPPPAVLPTPADVSFTQGFRLSHPTGTPTDIVVKKSSQV